ncbi:MAG: PH domain-containing protein [Thermoleophilaceae bacterium]|nr:PH domain-containing protein [Thermoleophilaceae bacterium]
MELFEGEQTIWAGHPTWRSMLAFHIKGIASTLAVVAVLWFLDWIGIDISTVTITFVAIAGIGITILTAWIQRFFTEYTITNKRLHIRKGVFSKTESSTNVDRIQNITSSQSPTQRMLQCGTLDFDTAGAGDDGFRFIGVNNPQDLRDRIMKANDVNQQASMRADQGGLA